VPPAAYAAATPSISRALALRIAVYESVVRADGDCPPHHDGGESRPRLDRRAGSLAAGSSCLIARRPADLVYANRPFERAPALARTDAERITRVLEYARLITGR
jgi:hypothetical protein